MNIKRLIESVAKEKNLPPALVERALKNAIITGIRKEKKIKSRLDIEFSDEGIEVFEVLKGLKQKLDISPDDLNRIAAFAAKEEFLRELSLAEKEKGFLEYVALEGEIVYGIVREIKPNKDIVVDLGKVDAILPVREQIKKEEYKKGDKLKALLLEVKKDRRYSEIILSRTHPKFLRKLLELETPEIKEGIIEIKGIAREPGEKAKVSVLSKNSRIDPVGVIVGAKASKINSISKELSGEKIDVIRYSESLEEYIKNALSPINVVGVRIIEPKRVIEIGVPKEKLSAAIGKRGINVKLLGKLLGWHIDIMSEEDFKKLAENK